MSGLRKDDLVAVIIDIDGEKRKMVEDIADTVLRKVLEEDENESNSSIESRGSSTSSSSSSSSIESSPLSINQLLSSSFSQQPPPVPVALNPFQLALCQSLLANNSLHFPIFGTQSPMFPLFVPPPQPAVESVELLKIIQNILAKQKK